MFCHHCAVEMNGGEKLHVFLYGEMADFCALFWPSNQILVCFEVVATLAHRHIRYGHMVGLCCFCAFVPVATRILLEKGRTRVFSGRE